MSNSSDTISSGYSFKKTSVTIALEMIGLVLGLNIPASKIKFNIPRVMDVRPDIDTDPNTFVQAVVSRDFDARVGGNQGFMYRRLPLSYVENTNLSPILPQQYPFSVADILAAINSGLNTSFTTDDLLNLSYTGEDESITILANPNSLAWIESFTLNVVSKNIPPIVHVLDLSGFIPYQG